MNVEELRDRYQGLVVTACEWRAMGLAEPKEMAAEVFSKLAPEDDLDLRSLYKAIDEVVFLAYQRHTGQFSVLDRLRASGGPIRPKGPPSDEEVYRTALSNLRTADKDLLQLHFWDELDDTETALVLRFDESELPERMARAGTRFLAKVNRKRPGVAISDVAGILRDLKPGLHHRFEDPAV